MTANSASPGSEPAAGREQALCCLDASGRILATNARWRAAMRRASGTWAKNVDGNELCASPVLLAALRAVQRGEAGAREVTAAAAQWPLPGAGVFVVRGDATGATISFATPGERTEPEAASGPLPDAYSLLGRAILAAAPDAAFVLAADGGDCWRVLDVNDVAATLHGATRDELLGASFFAATPAADEAATRAQFAVLQRTGAVRFATRRQRRDGRGVPCEVSATILRLAGHSYAIAFVRDCSEQQEREAELATQAMRLEIAVRSSGVGFWDWLLADDATFFSREWKAQLGYGPDEVADRFDEWQRLCHPDDIAPTLELVQRHLAGGTTVFEAEFRMRHRDGDYRWILSQGRVVRDAAGKAVRLVGCHVDVTARRRAEHERMAMLARLEQMQRLEAMGTLAGGLAHDFNNILTVIAGNVDLAELSIGDAATQREALGDVRRGAARARALVRQIQVFSRNDPPERSVTAVHELLGETLRLLRASLPNAIALASAVAPDLPDVDVDPQQIQQLLLNLGANAWQAIGTRPGRVELRAERVLLAPAAAAALDLPPGDYVRIVVADDGCGMDAATRERIFEPFFTTRLEHGGTGLGLSVVHGIARRHGGAVTVVSEPGQGSTFTLHLPAHQDPAAGATGLPAAGRSAGPGRLLLVEDDAALLRVQKRGLELLGHRVAAFDEPVAAFAALRSEPQGWAAVVADFDLPGLRGSEFARAVRELFPTLPIVLTSGLVTAELTLAVQQLGGARVLAKPFLPRDLAALLASLLAELQPRDGR